MYVVKYTNTHLQTHVNHWLYKPVLSPCDIHFQNVCFTLVIPFSIFYHALLQLSRFGFVCVHYWQVLYKVLFNTFYSIHKCYIQFCLMAIELGSYTIFYLFVLLDCTIMYVINSIKREMKRCMLCIQLKYM